MTISEDIPIQEFYFQTQDIQSYIADSYGADARDQFVTDVAEYLQREQNVPEEMIAEMIAEDALEATISDVIDKIENNSVALKAEYAFGPAQGPNLSGVVYSRSPVGSFYTAFDESISGMKTERKQPSDAFYKAVATFTDGEEKDWGKIQPELYEKMEEYEQTVFQGVKALVVEGTPTREVMWLIEYAKERQKVGE